MLFRKDKKQKNPQEELETYAREACLQCKNLVENKKWPYWMKLEFGTMWGGLPGRLRYTIIARDIRKGNDGFENAIGYLYAPDNDKWDKLIVYNPSNPKYPTYQHFKISDISPASDSFIRLLNSYENLNSQK